MNASARFRPLAALLLLLTLAGCAPTVKVEAPEEPIRIDVNVKIEQEVRIKVDKEVDKLLEEEELF